MSLSITTSCLSHLGGSANSEVALGLAGMATELDLVRLSLLCAQKCAALLPTNAQFATETGSPLFIVPTVVHAPGARYVGGGKKLGAKIQARFFPA